MSTMLPVILNVLMRELLCAKIRVVLSLYERFKQKIFVYFFLLPCNLKNIHHEMSHKIYKVTLL